MADKINHNTPEVNNDFNQTNEQHEKSEKAEQQNQENAACERQSVEDEQTKKKEEQDRQASEIEAERLAAEQAAQNVDNNFNNQANETQEVEIEKSSVSRVESDLLFERNTLKRETLEPHNKLTIGGQIEQKVHTDTSQENNALIDQIEGELDKFNLANKSASARKERIDQIEKRLDSYQNKARDNFNMTQQEQDKKEIEEDNGRSC